MANRDESTGTGRMPVILCDTDILSVENNDNNNIFRPLNKDEGIMRRRRNLPHWEQTGRTYFVTFHLADSLPQTELRKLMEEKEIWLRHHPKPWSAGEWKAYHRRFTSRIQKWLDAGYGSCALRDPDIGGIMESALRYFDGQRYFLDEFTVMPNHVHVLFMPIGDYHLDSILHSWKSFTANRINKRLNRSGTFWMDESFDHVVRSWEHLERFREYVRQNPAKAGLQEGHYIQGCGKFGIRRQ